MKRREFITLLAGATAASYASWPLPARAQQGERVRRIGVLAGGAVASDTDTQERNAAFAHSLKQLGWTDGRNVRIDYRYGLGNAANVRKYATELVALAPDVILASGASVLAPLLQATRTVPIVFVSVADPVGAGYVESMARPGGNATGFIQFEYSLSGKWLELLKEIAPGVTRAAVLRDPVITAGVGQFAVIQSVASSIGLDVSPVNVRDAGEIERAVTAFARSANGGLVVTASALSLVHSELILALAARHKLPAIYPRRSFVAAGGLISYGFDALDQVQRAAGYVDRILKGEKPSDLPVQAPTKYELVVNLKTAKALGLDVPPMLLARSDEVIE
jgi:putative tryptophan/tyrosine transport system substrate-binding protein